MESPNPPVEIEIAGQTYRVRPLTGRAVPRVQSWLRSQPRPVELAHLKSELEGLPAEAIRDAISGAAATLQSWPPQYPYDERAWRIITSSEDGMALWLHSALYPEHRELTVADCKAMLDDLDWKAVARITEGLHPTEVTEEMRWRAALARLAPELLPDVVDRLVDEATGRADDPKGEPAGPVLKPTGSTESSAA